MKHTIDALAESVSIRLAPKICAWCGRLIGYDRQPIGERKSGEQLRSWNRLTAAAGFSHGSCAECHSARVSARHSGAELLASELRVLDREALQLVEASRKLRQLRRRLRRELAEAVN